MATIVKKTNPKNIDTVKQEMFTLMLKKAGISRKAIYESARNRWMIKNTDVLSPSEIDYFKSQGIVF